MTYLLCFAAGTIPAFVVGYIYGRVRHWRDAETNARFVAVQEVDRLHRERRDIAERFSP